MRKFTKEDVAVFERLKEFDFAAESYLPQVEIASETSYRKVVSDLIEGFRHFCGRSAGGRTVCWAFADVTYVLFLSPEDPIFRDSDFYDAIRDINENYTDEDDEYDILLIDNEKILSVAKDIMERLPDELVPSYLYGLFVFAEWDAKEMSKTS